MKKLRIIALLLLLIICLAQIPLSAQSSDTQKPKELLSALGYLSQGSGRWTTIAQNAAGDTPDDAQAREIKKAVESNLKNGYTKATDIAYDIISASSCGYDVNTIGEKSPVALLSGYEGMLSQGANGPIYSLLALDSSGYETPENAVWDRQSLCDAILSFQTPEGGFRLTETMDADVDITAYALTALSRYADEDGMSPAIDRAVTWLMSRQNADATFSSLGVSASESTASVVMALVSLGIPVSGQRFTQDGVSVYDALLGFQNPDGGFSHEQGGKSNLLATEQAVMAMGTVCFGKSPFLLASVSPPSDIAN
ncbi:MAG: prenyltransferase/squalene oxidase repeat-containing protein, partial [Acetanaerobacterium sp.]